MREPRPRGAGEDGEGADTVGVAACGDGANPGECSALLEFLVGGQDQRKVCFCCLGKLSAA